MPIKRQNKSQNNVESNVPNNSLQSTKQSVKTKSAINLKGKLQLKPKNQGTKNTQSKVRSNKLKILFTIAPRNKAEYYLDLIQSFDVNMQLAILANGMAPKSIMELLGLASNEKVVIVSVIGETKLPDALATLDEKFATIKDGKGIAFTVPMTSVIGTLIYGFLSNNKMTVKEEKTK